VAKFDEHFSTSDMHLQKDKCTFSKGILSVKLQYLVNIKIKIKELRILCAINCENKKSLKIPKG
jgi:hypothetical protein